MLRKLLTVVFTVIEFLTFLNSIHQTVTLPAHNNLLLTLGNWLLTLFILFLLIIVKTTFFNYADAYPVISKLSVKPSKLHKVLLLGSIIVATYFTFIFNAPADDVLSKAVNNMETVKDFTDFNMLDSVNVKYCPVYFKYSIIEFSELMVPTVNAFVTIANMNETAPEDLDVDAIGQSFEYLNSIANNDIEVSNISDYYKMLYILLWSLCTAYCLYMIHWGSYLFHIEFYEEVYLWF